MKPNQFCYLLIILVLIASEYVKGEVLNIPQLKYHEGKTLKEVKREPENYRKSGVEQHHCLLEFNYHSVASGASLKKPTGGSTLVGSIFSAMVADPLTTVLFSENGEAPFICGKFFNVPFHQYFGNTFQLKHSGRFSGEEQQQSTFVSVMRENAMLCSDPLDQEIGPSFQSDLFENVLCCEYIDKISYFTGIFSRAHCQGLIQSTDDLSIYPGCKMVGLAIRQNLIERGNEGDQYGQTHFEYTLKLGRYMLEELEKLKQDESLKTKHREKLGLIIEICKNSLDFYSQFKYTDQLDRLPDPFNVYRRLFFLREFFNFVNETRFNKNAKWYDYPILELPLPEEAKYQGPAIKRAKKIIKGFIEIATNFDYPDDAEAVKELKWRKKNK